MRVRAKWAVTLLLLVQPVDARTADMESGFHLERRVGEATRLPWEFAAGNGATLPSSYDSRKQRYQLFVPESYKPAKSWPLIVFVSPGDDPMGWRAWRKPCEDAEWFFAAAYGVGNACPAGQRVRAILDVLDDVRRHYHIDPDRTYLAGFGGGVEPACRIAFALPDQFAGVIALSGDGPLPRLAHLRRKTADRLSVALVCGSEDRARRREEKYFAPLLKDLGIRSQLWVSPKTGHEMPAAPVLAEVQHWLEEDLSRRRNDRKEHINTEEGSPQRIMAAHALDEARKELAVNDTLHLGVDRLEWLIARWPRSEAGEKAVALLAELRADPRRSKALAVRSAAHGRSLFTAQAHALEQIGQMEEARVAWEQVARLADGEEKASALRQVKRLAVLKARTPYLGLSFAGDTTLIKAVTPGGPAHRAGMRRGDRLEQVGKVSVSTAAEVRDQVLACKPGEELRVMVRRDDRLMSLTVKVGSPPSKEEAKAR